MQIVTYNRPQLLLEALEQIEAQDYIGELEVRFGVGCRISLDCFY